MVKLTKMGEWGTLVLKVHLIILKKNIMKIEIVLSRTNVVDDLTIFGWSAMDILWQREEIVYIYSSRFIAGLKRIKLM